MNSFQSVWIAPSIILGIGLTRLLSDSVTVFRSRTRAKIDWVPLVWAACIFVWQVQYLWAVIELPNLVKTWGLVDFLILLGLSLFLFVASALVLPDTELREGETYTDSFRLNGRWALLAVSGWGALALIADWLLFGLAPLSYESGLQACVIVLPAVFLATEARRAREAITVVNLAVTLWAAWQFSPKFY